VATKRLQAAQACSAPRISAQTASDGEFYEVFNLSHGERLLQHAYGCLALADSFRISGDEYNGDAVLEMKVVANIWAL